MKQYPRIIYYDKETGAVLHLHNIGEPTIITVEDYGKIRTELDYENIKALSERNRENIGELHLEFGQYIHYITKNVICGINPETLELEFSYPDPSNPNAVELRYQTPLSEQLNKPLLNYLCA